MKHIEMGDNFNYIFCVFVFREKNIEIDSRNDGDIIYFVACGLT